MLTKFTKEYIHKVRVCSHLIEPPAAEVIGELLDEIERLQARVAEFENTLKGEQNEHVID